jgi:serine/threonine protein kinase
VRAKDGRALSVRADDGADLFDYGLRRFFDEARTLDQFHHPNIVHFNRYIEANGTAYLIMDYEEGESLEQLLSVRRRLEAWQIQPMLSSVLMGLKSVHDQLYLHRDIKPGNIFLRDDRPPLLLDFGSARQALENQRQSMTVVLTPGYAPIEQYAAEERQGPYSDLYSVGATVFRCLVGRHPPESTARTSAIYNGDEDPALHQTKDGRIDLDPAFISIVEWLMQPRARERRQSAMEVLTALDRLDTQKLADSAATQLYSGSTVGEPVADVPTLDLSQPVAPPASAPGSSQPAHTGTEPAGLSCCC